MLLILVLFSLHLLLLLDGINYGERCIYYLKGLKAISYYKIIFIVFIAIGPFMSLEFIFILADIVNGCMALPNLIGLIGLRKEIIVETQAYFKKDKDSIILEEFVCE